MTRQDDTEIEDRKERLSPSEWQRIAASVSEATAKFTGNGIESHETAVEPPVVSEPAEESTAQVD